MYVSCLRDTPGSGAVELIALLPCGWRACVTLVAFGFGPVRNAFQTRPG